MGGREETGGQSGIRLRNGIMEWKSGVDEWKDSVEEWMERSGKVEEEGGLARCVVRQGGAWLRNETGGVGTGGMWKGDGAGQCGIRSW